MRTINKLFLWFVSLFLWGVIIYSYQIVGFYWMIVVLDGELPRIWLAVVAAGLRFVIQSALLLGILRLILKILPSLEIYLKSTMPLALAGIIGSILRFFYNGWIPFRIIMEQVALMLGLLMAMVLLGKRISSGKKSYLSCVLTGLLVFLILIPIPL
ncbi:hypothetical protein [Thermococcus thioreducens]|uniref:Uncharacterized protein n=1 Tax=Thermococcus thioreducens TaxID=277988 RepID=A0A0Q2M1Q9_9EURY|nr:hypothetical protein [Thermococcus thioreducens]ASJ12658.1 hypothetical protein A3L14_07070 [Thermococcus thioreducens]KQH81993.1 hypothetical protein AMR53_07845 [Thermococcus thioreducens]SEV87117.1 hypothetical protein SAMN05216170_0533 [Thermococcus thioreducens]